MQIYKNKEWLMNKYINERLSIDSIAKLCAVNHATIWYFLNKFDIQRRATGVPKGFKRSEKNRRRLSLCKLGDKNPNYGKPLSEDQKKKISESLWKGGTFLSSRGYRLIYMPNHPHPYQGHYVTEHRLIAEKMLGRYLEHEEIVHHINGDPLDNRSSNLLVCSSSEHRKIHVRSAKKNRLGQIISEGNQE